MKTTNDFKDSINIESGNGKISIQWIYTLMSAKEEDGSFSCWIPSFDIYFSATDKEQASFMSKIITKSFINYHIVYKKGLKSLSIALNKKGFKTDMMTMKRMIDNSPAAKSSFKSNPKPSTIYDNSSIEAELLEVA